MRFRIMCKAKIHRAKVTNVDLHYEGSIGIDKALMNEAGIFRNERVQVLNINSGVRFETYVIEEKKNSGIVSLYGPAAHLGKTGDLIIIISYFLVEEKEAAFVKPKVVYVDGNNKIVKGKT